MTVLTITREIGALGDEVAESVAEELDLRLIDHAWVENDLADRVHVPRPTVHRYMEGGATLFDYWRVNRKDFATHAAREIYDLAVDGNAVISGWFAPQLLRPISHVLSVRICAPFETRVSNLLACGEAETLAAAKKAVKANDEAHAKCVQRLYHVDWQDPLLYDLVLNSSQLSREECGGTISRLAQEESFRETDASRAALAELRRIVHAEGGRESRESLSVAHDRRHVAARKTQGYERPNSREDRDPFL